MLKFAHNFHLNNKKMDLNKTDLKFHSALEIKCNYSTKKNKICIFLLKVFRASVEGLEPQLADASFLFERLKYFLRKLISTWMKIKFLTFI